MTMHAQRSPLAAVILIALSATTLAGLAACGGPSAPTTESPPPTAAAAPTAAEVPAATAAEQEAAAAVAAREAELKAKEVEMQLREQALADREAAAAASAEAAKKAATPRPTTTSKPVAKAPAPVPAPAAAPPPPPVTVPAGTQVSVRLNSGYSTKTTALGQAVNAELASDLSVGGRVVARAGAPISGTITEVTSGSSKIGAVPALKIDFTQLVAADGRTLPVAIRINQKGQSEKGRDTAKIVGGTAAGAIIGHQVDSGSGKVIGGIIGGAAGAVGAKKTGTEVEIAAGTVLAANVRTAFTYDGR
jgi:hypothetical protein